MNYFFEGLKKGQKQIGEDLARVINSIMLSVVYVIGVGFTSMFGKLFKKRFLEVKLDKESQTYWSELNLSKKPIKEYYRQF